GLEAGLGRLRKYVLEHEPDNPSLIERLSAASILLEAITMTEQRVVASLTSGKPPGPAASMLKVQRTEMMQRIDEMAVEAGGAHAAIHEPATWHPESNLDPVGPEALTVATAKYLNNRAGSIYGGSNEVQRNIMAKAVLGL
ncbi:MAG: acyl-CoA dehydrogenase family protein, partial [Henriciella sp.]